jgi:guanylate kinase
MERSISCTTRSPRGNEVDGKAYHFLNLTEFERRVAAGEFLEHAVVHGNRYGTLRKPVEAVLASGRSIMMVIDVQGAAQVRQSVKAAGGVLKRSYVDVFIAPPSLELLRERLVRRNEDAPEVIERRVVNARGEMDQQGEYRYRVVNDDLETAYQHFKAIVHAERCRCDVD